MPQILPAMWCRGERSQGSVQDHRRRKIGRKEKNIKDRRGWGGGGRIELLVFCFLPLQRKILGLSLSHVVSSFEAIVPRSDSTSSIKLLLPLKLIILFSVVNNTLLILSRGSCDVGVRERRRGRGQHVCSLVRAAFSSSSWYQQVLTQYRWVSTGTNGYQTLVLTGYHWYLWDIRSGSDGLQIWYHGPCIGWHQNLFATCCWATIWSALGPTRPKRRVTKAHTSAILVLGHQQTTPTSSSSLLLSRSYLSSSSSLYLESFSNLVYLLVSSSSTSPNTLQLNGILLQFLIGEEGC